MTDAPTEQAHKYDPVLMYAWELYETYSTGSQAQKQSNSGIRQRMIWLIFMTSVLAVITSLPGIRQWLEFTVRPYMETNVGGWTTPLGNFTLSATLIILSVMTSALLAFAGQFSPLKAWIMYRAGADRIRSEIYLYRMKAGQYAQYSNDPNQARAVFLERIEKINQQIYELETAPPFLQLVSTEDKHFKHSLPRIWWNRLARFVLLRWKVNTTGKGEVKAIETDQIDRARQGEKVRLSGRYYPEHDDGFNPLLIEDYIEYRAMPQRNWYVKKVYEDYEKIKDWRKVTLTIGGLSAVLAAIQLEPYIVITTAAAVAVNTHIQLNMIGSTYGNYHITASRIDSELMRWRNLPDDERHSQKVISDFVSRIESILESERIVWMQQASQAQQESEQTLIKGVARRENAPIVKVDGTIEQPGLNGIPTTTGQDMQRLQAQATAYVAGDTAPQTIPTETPDKPTDDKTSADATTTNDDKPVDPTEKLEKTK
jgi:hypothetical protein